MSVGAGDILGTILILVCCVAYGLWMSNRRHDEGVFTVTCPICGDDDLTDNKYYYVCNSCASVIRR